MGPKTIFRAKMQKISKSFFYSSLAHTMSDTITMFSPVFTLYIQYPGQRVTLNAVPYAYEEEEAVVALGRAILDAIQDLDIALDPQIRQQIQEAKTEVELSDALDGESWVTFYLNKQVIKLPPGQVIVAKSACDKVDKYLGDFYFKTNWVNGDVKHHGINSDVSDVKKKRSRIN